MNHKFKPGARVVVNSTSTATSYIGSIGTVKKAYIKTLSSTPIWYIVNVQQPHYTQAHFKSTSLDLVEE